MSKFTAKRTAIQPVMISHDDLKLLENVKSTGKFTLQSDREIYRFLEYQNGKFYHRTGSTEMNADTSFYEVTERDAVELLINYAAIKSIVWSLGEVKNSSDALKVLNQAP